jgi:hypothetical protein
MFWVYAMSYATKMVNLESFWDRAFKKFVGQTMGSPSFILTIHPECNCSVSSFPVNGALPQPAGFREINSGHKAIFKTFVQHAIVIAASIFNRNIISGSSHA